MTSKPNNLQNIVASAQSEHLSHLAEAGCEKHHFNPVVFGWSAMVENVADRALHTAFA
jgi:hypothetical protein